MIQRSLLLWVCGLSMTATAFGQQPAGTPSLRERVERGLQREDLPAFLELAQKDPTDWVVISAVLAAGQTNDSFWVPHLQPFLKFAREKRTERRELAGVTQLALAKLGEGRQLQEIAQVSKADYPGSKRMPASSALLSLLALKLLDKERPSHINEFNFDEAIGLFAGLNIPPKKSYATE